MVLSAPQNSSSPLSVTAKVRALFGGVAVSSVPPIESSVSPPTTHPTTQNQALDVLDQVLHEIEETVPSEASVISQVMPQAVQQATDTLNPVSVRPSTTKEAVTDTMDMVSSGGAATTETEPPKEWEIPVEVESYIQKVKSHADQLPQEIVVVDDGTGFTMKPYPSQPVIVLPITPEEEQQGARKSSTFSIRWLVEWSRKIMKMFEGMVIYRADT